MSTLTCSFCNEKISLSARNCPNCQSDVGFPNVRATQIPGEIGALQKRVDDAEVSSGLRKCKDVINRFEHCVSISKAVFCRSLDMVHELVTRENILYISFQKQVNSGLRLPNDDIWEIARPAVEATLFPHYSDQINFMCLTANNKGLTNYGSYSIVLKDHMICNRASVFEENSVIFMDKHKVVAGKPVPPGYRASWSSRGKLAVAKLHSRIDPATSEDHFPEILMRSGADNSLDDFIEVHIYGPISPKAFERIVGPKPVRGADLVLWKSVETKCRRHGIILEEC